MAAQDGPGDEFDAAVASEAARIGCADPVVTIEVTTSTVVAMTCTYIPRITSNVWPGGLPVSTSASSFVVMAP